MRIYTVLDEHRVRAKPAVRGWYRAGVITLEQADRMLHDVRVDVVQANEFFRVGLGGFTLFVIAALAALADSFVRQDTAVASAAIVIAVVCVCLAEMLARRFRFYRHGVEEALVVAAVVLVAVGVGLLYEDLISKHGHQAETAALIAGALAAMLAYLRFGYVYTAVAGIVCVALVPVAVASSPAVERALAAAIFGGAFLAVRPSRLRHRDVWLGDEYGQIQAAAWLGMYVALNVKIGFDSVGEAFYWFTYAMTFVVPAAGLVLGIRHKDRPLITVNVVAAIVTLGTNKSYLRWPRHEWDPILLGVLLIGVSVGLRRWLASGAGGHRAGFTVTPVEPAKTPLLAAVSAVPFGTVAHAPASHAPASHATRPPDFDGGRSGGGGADSGF